MSVPTFNLDPALDVDALAGEFRDCGRVRIPRLIDAAAADALHDHLRSRDDWRTVLNSGERVLELSRSDRASLSDDQRDQLDAAIYAGARTGFQYRFETLRVPDEETARRERDDPLDRFATWLSTGAARDLLRTIVGSDRIAFADAQATAYAPGDFLTGHDDRVAGKQRHAAYVFGLNPTWRAEWGGALLFHEADGELSGRVPGFNTLDLFRVGQLHSVSEVTRAAAYRRYSITGWLRER